MANNIVEKKFVVQRMNYDKDQYEYLKITNPESLNKFFDHRLDPADYTWEVDYEKATLYEDSDMVINNRGFVFGYHLVCKVIYKRSPRAVHYSISSDIF